MAITYVKLEVIYTNLLFIGTIVLIQTLSVDTGDSNYQFSTATTLKLFGSFNQPVVLYTR